MENKNVSNFFEAFEKELAKGAAQLLGSEYELEFRQVKKANETYDALTIKPVGSNIGVNLNANALYAEYEKGTSLETIVDKAVNMAKTALKNRPDFDIDAFKDYEKMKSTLVIEVISKEANAELLEKVPYKELEDMAIVYRFLVGSAPEGTGTILITNQMLESYGITAEQLHDDAIRFAAQNRPMEILGMSQVLAKQMGVDSLEALGLNIPQEDEKVFVASTKDNLHGAAVIAYPDFLEKASERLGGSFFILPSSIHECILVPDKGGIVHESLKNMVREVNATTVDSVDKLTDNVYHYNAVEKVFETVEKFVDRQSNVA